MRNTLIIFGATLALAILGGCPGAGWTDGYFIGSENGQQFGGKGWENDPTFHKPGTYVTFPWSNDGVVVSAGEKRVAFTADEQMNLIVDEVRVSSIRLTPAGEVLADGQLAGYVVYVRQDDGTLATAIVDAEGLALTVSDDDGRVHLRLSTVPVLLAGPNEVPLNAEGLPVAEPTR